MQKKVDWLNGFVGVMAVPEGERHRATQTAYRVTGHYNTDLTALGGSVDVLEGWADSAPEAIELVKQEMRKHTSDSFRIYETLKEGDGVRVKIHIIEAEK